jgi:fumarylacetoacetase
MGLGKSVWTACRRSLQQLLSKDEARLRDDADLRQRVFVAQKDATMHLPIAIGYVGIQLFAL